MLSIRGFFNGMQASIIETTVRGQTGALQIHRKGLLRSANASSLRLDIPTDDAFLSQIRSVPGVTAALAAAAATQRPLTRRGTGRSVSFATAMTVAGELRSSLSADTEVFYMAGRQLEELAARLLDAGWAADTPVLVVSRAGWPDQLHSSHVLGQLGAASALHAGRPAVVTVGAGAAALPAEAPDVGADRGADARAAAGLELAQFPASARPS